MTEDAAISFGEGTRLRVLAMAASPSRTFPFPQHCGEAPRNEHARARALPGDSLATSNDPRQHPRACDPAPPCATL